MNTNPHSQLQYLVENLQRFWISDVGNPDATQTQQKPREDIR